MTNKLRIVLAQLNLTVGDIDGNLNKHLTAALTARDQFTADVIVFPELGLTGYPPEDLLLRPAFIEEAQLALNKFIATVTGIHCLISHPFTTTHGLYNTCSLIHNGVVLGRYSKQYLPNYGVFDEDRYFIPSHGPCIIPINGIPVGLVICEDLWEPEPTQQAAAHGARLILSPNASPFETDKHEQRIAVLSKRAELNHVAIVYVNNTGGQDELVFDGGSMVVNAEGKVCQLAGFFNETLLPVDVTATEKDIDIESAPIKLPSKEERIYQCLVMGLRDYIEKNHFPGVLVGLSGGIDSALTLAIAVDALGKDRVFAVSMPSRYTAEMSLEDADTLANQLDVPLDTISIEPVFQSFLETLHPFLNKQPGITEENLQSRCRALILMALSNKTGNLVLTTGNRSELAVGYCTIYGDMAGGFAVLKDVLKTEVYQLAHYRNQQAAIIPQRILDRPPTAELAPDQKDEDSLPPYAELDKILEAYLNHSYSVDDIAALGFNRDLVNKIVNLIHRSEYKRRQSAIGTHINHKSFGKDWRYPLTNGFKR